MNQSIEAMIEAYHPKSVADRKNVLAELIQEIALCGLSRAGFFEHAAFYGGTALRIYHGLNRYSEDLDFSLKTPDFTFDIADYLPAIEQEARSFGFNLVAEKKQKSVESQIQSAFLKGNTQQHLLTFFPRETSALDAAIEEKTRVKIEIDVDPAPGASFERKYRLLPTPFEAQLYDAPSLFAGKIHAVLCRGWKSRIKGRDLYDYVFHLSRGTAVNIEHLQAKLVQTGSIEPDRAFTIENLKALLYERFACIDYTSAKLDVEPFLTNTAELDVWSEEFFCQITADLKSQ